MNFKLNQHICTNSGGTLHVHLSLVRYSDAAEVEHHSYIDPTPYRRMPAPPALTSIVQALTEFLPLVHSEFGEEGIAALADLLARHYSIDLHNAEGAPLYSGPPRDTTGGEQETEIDREQTRH